MTNVLTFPIGKISVKLALEEILKAYDERREMVGIAFRISNLSPEQLQASLAEASRESVDSLLELLRRDVQAFTELVELLADVRVRLWLSRT
jgi:hypothetical protein